jgi:hypothetical protein
VVSSGELEISENTTYASLTVLPNAHLTITNGATLTITGDLTLQSDATGTATFVDQGGTLTVLGKTTVQQTLTGVGSSNPDGRFWYVGSPVTGAATASFNAEGTDKLWFYSEPDHAYTEITDNTTTLSPGVGYIARFGEQATVSFEGELNTGDFSYNITRTGTEHEKRGFNLLANPYPSYVNWATAERTNLLPTMWYRTENTNFDMVFDTYNAVSAVGTSNGTQVVNQHIPPMQAFWVRVDADGASGQLQFDNSMRSHQTDNFLKEDVVQDVLRLQLSQGTNSDELILVFNSQAQNGIDAFDSEKMFANIPALPQLYSLVENQKLVINGMQSVKTNPAIPLGIKIGTEGTYSIAATEIDGLYDIPVVLEDKALNLFQDLSTGNYTFTTEVANTDERFVVHLKSDEQATTIEEMVHETITIFSQNKHAVVQSTETAGEITITDVLGRMVVHKTITGNTTRIPLEPGVYVVTVTTNTKEYVQRVVIL